MRTPDARKTRKSVPPRLPGPGIPLIFWFVLGGGVLLYAPLLKAGFLLDDTLFLHSPAIKDLGNLEFLWRAFNTRLLPGITFALNYAAGRDNPAGYHAVNIAVHLVNALLVYAFAALTFRTPRVRGTPSAEHGTTIASLASIIFLCHPLVTQTVAYVVQRSTSLAAMFYLLTLIGYVKARMEPGRRIWFFAALVSLALGIVSKEMIVTLPLALTLYEFFFFSGGPGQTRARIVRLLPFWALVLAVPLLLSLETDSALLRLRPQVLASGLALTNVLTEINVLNTYLRLMVFPVNQNVDYDYPFVHGLGEPSVVWSVIVLAGCMLAAVRLFSRSRPAAYAIWWFFITLSVEFAVCSWVGRDMIFEHYAYLATVGFALFLPSIAFTVAPPRNALRAVAGAIAFFCMLSMARVFVWSDVERLLQDNLVKSPRKLRAIHLLSEYYIKNKQYDRALRVLHLGFRLAPEHSYNYVHLGTIYEEQNRLPEARRAYETAAGLEPPYARAYFKAGYFFARDRRFAEAEEYYRKSLYYDPKLTNAYCNLGNLYIMQGKSGEAITFLRSGLREDPYDVFCRNSLASVYALKGDKEGAIREFETMIRMFPDSVIAYKNLGNLYFMQNDLPRAEKMLRKARALAPQDGDVTRLLERIGRPGTPSPSKPEVRWEGRRPPE
ncbi:MAG: tetratricopeptide repeat protein [Candidatus Omnitrophota bacterium]|nr:tetratricopeptide repeat protein [Candidatus Omnitrophota bacterium]MDZ4241887.1 tetratricopeptide repeat protein [Candidatus Omnitrophota bacterium]